MPGHWQSDGKLFGSHPEASCFRLVCLSERSCQCLVAIHLFHLSQGQTCPAYRHTCHLVPGFQPQHGSCSSCQVCTPCLVLNRSHESSFLLSSPWPQDNTTIRALDAAWASSHASWDLSVPQTLILRTAISGLTILVLPDSDVEGAYFSEDDGQKGRLSSHIYQHCLSSSSLGHLEHEH